MKIKKKELFIEHRYNIGFDEGQIQGRRDFVEEIERRRFYQDGDKEVVIPVEDWKALSELKRKGDV